MEPDFSGYATKAGLKCSDGRTIMSGAFKHQDKMRVPLVWQHGHSDPENVLGHTILESRDDGVYAYGFFNKSPKAVHAKQLLDHGDINMLSIWANELVERSSRVLHGTIREVSLVLSGANPGAIIENVTIKHSDGDETLDDEAIIYTGLELEHADGDSTSDDNKDDDADDETIQDIIDTMSDKQKDVLHYMLSQALSSADGGEELKQDNVGDDKDDSTKDKEGTGMTRNVFEKDATTSTDHVLSHEDMKGIVADAMKTGSLKEAVEAYALSHGINDIETLFPEAKMVRGAAPEFITRRLEWVSGVLTGANKTPFSRIKSATADLTFDEARAKGYIKGNLKKEEFFGVSSRTTTPTTIYKKQKLDRDDIIDITDFDVVAWMKGEMRIMLDEEIARAVLIGDGREVDDEDKIPETHIRPIAKDDELYTITVNVNIDDASSSVTEIVDAIVMNRAKYRGTGTPTLYTTEEYIARFLLLKDTLGRRIYSSLDQLATELRVRAIVPVEALENEPDIVAVIVNMNDYTIGADKGGQVAMFDDFDIDYNQYKYLIETRISGALTRIKSAIVVRKTAGANVLVVPNQPVFNPETGQYSIVNQTGVVYKNGAGTTVNAAGSPYTIAPGASDTITATPAAGYYFSTSEDDAWVFTADEA